MKIYAQRWYWKSLVLVMVLIMTLATTAYATDTRASSRISTYSANILQSTSNFKIFFSISAVQKMKQLGARSITVQWEDGSSWITENILAAIAFPQMQNYDTSTHSAFIPYTPLHPEKTYRVVVDLFATDDTGTSIATLYGY